MAGMTGSAASGIEGACAPGVDGVWAPGVDVVSTSGVDLVSTSGVDVFSTSGVDAVATSGVGGDSAPGGELALSLGGAAPSGQIESSGSYEIADSEEESETLRWLPGESDSEISSWSSWTAGPEPRPPSLESPNTELSASSRPSSPLTGYIAWLCIVNADVSVVEGVGSAAGAETAVVVAGTQSSISSSSASTE